MRYKILSAFIACFTLSNIDLYSQTDTLAGVVFEHAEVTTLKHVTSIWGWGTGLGATVLLALAVFIALPKYLKSIADDAAKNYFEKQFKDKTPYFEKALEQMAKTYEKKSKANIVVISKEKGQQAKLREYLEAKGYGKLVFKGIDEVNAEASDFDTNGVDLMFFNHLGEDLKGRESILAPILRKYKKNTRLLVTGSGRLSEELVNEIGQISLANNWDTLDQRIVEALDVPIIN